MMRDSPRKRLDHEVPLWVTENPTYLITICAQDRKANLFCLPEVGVKILQSIRYYHVKERWFCHLAVLMPDHVHFLLTFPDISSFARVIGEWKKWVVKEQGILWQENFFEHRLRKEESIGEKAEYILQNPVRARLVERSEDWPYFWMEGRD